MILFGATRTTMEVLIDIMALMGRSDVKKEIIKELERHSVTLSKSVPESERGPGEARGYSRSN